MCWAVPAKIISIKDNIATVELNGLRKEALLDLLDGAALGDYVLVHAGYAIQKVRPEQANFTLEFFQGKLTNA